MNFSWQQRVLILVSAQLLVTSLPAVASSFVTPTSAMKSPAFGKRNGRYNPLLRVSPGGDDSASADNQEIGEPATTPSLLGPNAKSPPGFFRSKLPKLPWHKFPDYLTYARCLAIPAFVTLFYSNLNGKSHLYTGTIFAFASITDWLDGFLARRWDVSTSCE